MNRPNQVSGAPTPPPYRVMCTDCGLSRTRDPDRCADACQFIRPDYARLETRTHGRARDPERVPDELFFGPYEGMYKGGLIRPLKGAQWTGMTTRLAERLLEDGRVDAIIAVGAAEDDFWRPVPLMIRRPEDMVRCRGMRMGFAPLVKTLEEARDQGLKRIGIIGLPCQVNPIRALQESFGFEALYVIGVPCADNTTTENFRKFLALITPEPDNVTYMEFRPDYRVELRFRDGKSTMIPFLKLPLSKLPDDYFPLPCRACVDYTNALADIVVGSMGGEGRQWIIIRNARGRELADLLGDELELLPPGDKGKRFSSVKGFKENVERAAGGQPVRKMPDWARPIVAWLMPRTGPRGLEFARTRVEMKAIEAIVHLRRTMPKRVATLLPPFIWTQAAPYGLNPTEDEMPRPLDAPVPEIQRIAGASSDAISDPSSQEASTRPPADG